MCVATACCSYLRTHWQVAGCIIAARQWNSPSSTLLWCAFAATQDISMSCVNKGAMLLLAGFLLYWVCMKTLLCTQIIMREAWGRKARGERAESPSMPNQQSIKRMRFLRPASPHTYEHWLIWCMRVRYEFGIHSNARESRRFNLRERDVVCGKFDIMLSGEYPAVGVGVLRWNLRMLIFGFDAVRCVGGLHEPRQSYGTEKFIPSEKRAEWLDVRIKLGGRAAAVLSGQFSFFIYLLRFKMYLFQWHISCTCTKNI